LWPILVRSLGSEDSFCSSHLHLGSEGARQGSPFTSSFIGFGAFDHQNKRIYATISDGETVLVTPASNISPYLIEGRDLALQNREQPVGSVPELRFGTCRMTTAIFFSRMKKKSNCSADQPEARFTSFAPLLSAQEYSREKPLVSLVKGCFVQTVRKIPRSSSTASNCSRLSRRSKRETTQTPAIIPTALRRNSSADYKICVSTLPQSETRHTSR